MIESLSVKGLNNRIDADWEFNEDLNIITGKNGSGKTTVLKLLWYLISGNLERVIFEIPFQQISVKGDSLLLGIHRRSASEFTLISTDFFSNTQKTGTVEQLKDTLKSLNKHIVTKSKKSFVLPHIQKNRRGLFRTQRCRPSRTDLQLQQRRCFSHHWKGSPLISQPTVTDSSRQSQPMMLVLC